MCSCHRLCCSGHACRVLHQSFAPILRRRQAASGKRQAAHTRLQTACNMQHTYEKQEARNREQHVACRPQLQHVEAQQTACSQQHARSKRCAACSAPRAEWHFRDAFMKVSSDVQFVQQADCFFDVKRLVKQRLLDGCTRRIPRNVTGHVTVFNTGWHGCDWLCAITDPTCGPENRVVNMENISKSTQIQPKRAIMAYGLPMQLSGALGPTNTIKSHLGSDCFWCWSHVVFANGADLMLYSRKWPGLKKGILPVLGRKEPICWSRLDLSDPGRSWCHIVFERPRNANGKEGGEMHISC